MSLTQGEWTGPWKCPGNSTVGSNPGPGDAKGVFVVHAMLLHTGKLLMYSGGAEVEYTKEVVVWDPLVTVPDPDTPGSRMPDTSSSNVKLHQTPHMMDIFCSHHIQLKDGKILIVGGASHPTHTTPGHMATGHGTGVKHASIFDPMASNSLDPVHGGSIAFTRLNDMAQARWYPTAVHMPDDKVYVFSGRTDETTINIAHQVEVFDPSNSYDPQVVTLTPGPIADSAFKMPTFPGMHLVKGAKIYHSGTNWRYEGTLNNPNAPTTGFTYAGNTAVDGVPTLSFHETGRLTAKFLNYGNTASSDKNNWLWPNNRDREEGTSILLSPAYEGKILLIGGGRAMPKNGDQWMDPRDPTDTLNHHSDNGTVRGWLNANNANGRNITTTVPLATNNGKKAEILNTQSTPPAWTNLPDMNHFRINVNAVNLVDGKVLIIGGHNYYKWYPEQEASFQSGIVHAMACEIFNPATNTFTQVADLAFPRMYHSAAVLLPDGTVFVAGGADGNSSEPGETIALNRKDFEIYKPPYLFIEPTVTPPEITSVVSGPNNDADKVYYGRHFHVMCTNIDDIDKVVLIRPGAMSHHTDTEQRHIPFKKNASEFGFRKTGNKLQVPMTNDPSIAPPGYYMLFVIKTNGRPCGRAKFVKVEPYC